MMRKMLGADHSDHGDRKDDAEQNYDLAMGSSHEGTGGQFKMFCGFTFKDLFCGHAKAICGIDATDKEDDSTKEVRVPSYFFNK